LRVLFFLTDLEIGGTPGVVRELATRLRSPSLQTAVACLTPWGPVAGELEAAGVLVTPLNATSTLHLPAILPRFVRLAAKFDVVFSFLMHANVVASLSGRWLSGVRLLQAVQTTQPYPAWHWPLQGIAALAAERIVVPSPSVAAATMERSHVPADRITVIPNALDVASFSRLRKPRFGGQIRVGFIGRLDPIKRVPDLVRAMAPLTDATLDIFGEGEDRPRIESVAAESDVSHRVVLHGRIAQPQPALEQIDVLVLPSDAEGFPLVVIEAMAAGVPLVVTDAPGIRDVVRHRETALLVPPRSPAAIAEAVRELQADPTLRERLVANAIAHVEGSFTWEPILAQYRAVLGC
jgi:phosphatidylinositol alpha-mannosyltransferase